MNSPAAKYAHIPPPPAVPAKVQGSDMDRLVALMSERAGYLNRLGEIQLSADQYLHMFARTVQKEHTDLTEGVAEIESELEDIVRRHPEWFEHRKSIPTPFGTPKLTEATSLAVADEARSIDLVMEKYRRRCTEFLRIAPALNLAALDTLSDEELLSLGIHRKTEDKFSIADAKVNLGKAVKKVSATKEGK